MKTNECKKDRVSAHRPTLEKIKKLGIESLVEMVDESVGKRVPQVDTNGAPEEMFVLTMGASLYIQGVESMIPSMIDGSSGRTVEILKTAYQIGLEHGMALAKTNTAEDEAGESI